MEIPKKILVVRFSSIGDIVLTTPVIRCLKKQLNCDIHFLTKEEYQGLLQNNPYIDKLICIKKVLKEVMSLLTNEKYDYIIDLHGNLRSFFLFKLSVKTLRVNKSNFKKFLLINFGINFLNEDHIVDRYFKSVKILKVENDEKGLDYFIPERIDVDFNVNQKYIVWVLGAGHENKKLSQDQISKVCNKVDYPVILLGGNGERDLAELIISDCKKTNILNYCGVNSFDQSAYLIKHCQIVITNDTGFMHIAASFDKKIISLWGCTQPTLGFRPYLIEDNSIEIISPKSTKPCSRHGKYCSHQFDGCIKNINPQLIIKQLTDLGFIK